MPLATSKKTIYTLLSIVLVLAVVMGLTKALLSNSSPKYFGNYEVDMFIDDTLLGYAPKPCASITSTKAIGEDIIYETSYTINCNGLRTTAKVPRLAKKHLLFFGCSFTFGEGLADTATLPWIMNDSAYDTYNFGMPGYGPQQMLSRLEADMLTEVKEDSGIALYTLLPDHIYRATGAPYVLYYWGSKMPYYTLEDTLLLRHRSFKRGQPFRTAWYKALGFGGLMNINAIAKPEVKQRDIDLVVAMVLKSEQLYLAKYPTSKFYILCYPSACMHMEYEQLVTALKQAGISVFDYRNLFAMDEEHTIAGDGHPNALANRLIVEQLKADLSQ